MEKCAVTCAFFADEAAGFLAPRRLETGAQESWVAYEPLGVVLATMSWNIPLGQVLRFAAPALPAATRRCSSTRRTSRAARSYGLAASEWTRDTARELRVGRRIRSEALFVNTVVASDSRVPLGGTKRSGYGRELAAEGLREFTNVRTVWSAGGGALPVEPPTE